MFVDKIKTIVFLPHGKLEKVANGFKCLIIDWSLRFPSLSQILTSSTNFMSSAVGLIRWWILFERSMFEILTATVINLSGITKLSNLLRSQWFLGPTCQTQESPAPACPAVCWAPLPPSPPACCSWEPC